MNPNHDQRLEAAIQRELQTLPELAAPAALVGRVLRVIEQRSRLPWYRRSWQTWPMALQAASLAVLLVLFGGLCLGGWELSHAEAITLAVHRAGEWLSGLNLIGNTLEVLANAALLVAKKLGTGVVIALLVMAGLGYALCVGLGTVYYRLAFAKREEFCL
jgi:predicted lysophospholipase L1 biosynthesis ABC-type transport system permease subunit